MSTCDRCQRELGPTDDYEMEYAAAVRDFPRFTNTPDQVAWLRAAVTRHDGYVQGFIDSLAQHQEASS